MYEFLGFETPVPRPPSPTTCLLLGLLLLAITPVIPGTSGRLLLISRCLVSTLGLPGNVAELWATRPYLCC